MNSQLLMQRAIELAQRAKGQVSPNPLVGCVIYADGQLIGEGYHQRYGQAHAEVHALNTVKNKSLLSKATVFVTLEPCSHFGKTPPCADALVRAGVQKVVVANLDPNPLVAGKGVAKLKEAGIEVEIGVLEKEAAHMNRRFLTAFTRQRPYIILKWAQTQDGFVAHPDGSSKWISNALSRKMVHKWRSEEDAILVGKNTVLLDNPSLNVREWKGKNPTRIILMGNGLRELEKKTNQLAILNDQIPTRIYYYSSEKNTIESFIIKQFTQTVFLPLSKENFFEELLQDLYQHQLHSLFVEGGTTILNEFIRQGLYDEIRRFTATEVLFNEGIVSPQLHLAAQETLFFEKDKLEIFFKK